MGLVRTQVQFDEEQHRKLKEEAFQRGISVSALLREIVDGRFAPRPRRKRELRKLWAFIGSGRSDASDVSIHHDNYLSGQRK